MKKAYHPLNLALRFILELSALTAAGIWGYQLSETALRFFFAAAFPLALAVLWAVFAVPGDKSRSGKTVLPTPGPLRLLLETAFFAFAGWAFIAVGHTRLGIIFGALVLMHYFFSLDRLLWLIREK